MLRATPESLDAVRPPDERGWTLPRYDGWGFAAIPGTIERLLTGATDRTVLPDAALAIDGDDRPERVVLVYFDALGWNFLERYADHPFIERFSREGRASILTSQFPSTTAAHITTIHTGASLPEHGVLEWHCYDPRLDRVISPLLFGFHDGEPGGLAAAGVRPEDIFGQATLYERLAAAGVRASVHQPDAYSRSAPTLALAGSAEVIGYAEIAGGLASLSEKVATGAAYGFVYLDAFDTALHRFGPGSPEADAVALGLLDALDVFADTLPDDTLLLVTADHGQVPVHPERTTYLNRVWPEIERHLRRGSDGGVLAPAGSSRDFFLHVLPERVAEVEGELTRRLDGVASVHRVADLLAEGWFGPEPSPRLIGRLSEILVVPHVGHAVWWHDPPRFENAFLGMHGGPAQAEMEIPFLSRSV